MHDLSAAFLRLDADVAGEANAVMQKAEVEVVLRGKDHHALRQRGKDEVKHRPWIGDGEGRWAPHLLDISLIGLEPWQVRPLSAHLANDEDQHCDEHEKL